MADLNLNFISGTPLFYYFDGFPELNRENKLDSNFKC